MQLKSVRLRQISMAIFGRLKDEVKTADIVRKHQLISKKIAALINQSTNKLVNFPRLVS